ncbi:MAG: tripartite tricarboxylate transporter TctB family protein [Burkholderiaceae bacterium]|nr:tripartite tricarboxylate transporter TctB family protein [Sulfuritalea sp.]MCF8175409.1 tripartite tricarboxylate transporter TctB family protein [Burkholderiaceae bacterium]
MKYSGVSWWPVAPPLVFIATSAVLTRFITDRPQEAAAMARGIAGPTTWPTFMLYGVMIFAFAWAIERLAQVLRQREGGAAVPQANNRPVSIHIWLGIVLVLAYGFSLPLLGFTFATVIYIPLWLWLGGIRSPISVPLTAVLGTVALLYLFVKLALMPLDRGVGVIGEYTIALYRLLQIF